MLYNLNSLKLPGLYNIIQHFILSCYNIYNWENFPTYLPHLLLLPSPLN